MLLVEETGGSEKKTIDLFQVRDKLYHIMYNVVHLVLIEIRTHNISDDRH